MKVFKQIIIIFIIFQIGNIISNFLKEIFFIPGSIVGMVIMFILLLKEYIKLDDIKEISDFLLKHMGLFFIPLGVGLLNYFDVLKSTWIKLIIVLVISNIIVMLVSAKTTEILIKIKKTR